MRIPEEELGYAFLLLVALALSAVVVLADAPSILWLPIVFGAFLSVSGWFICAASPRFLTVPAMFSASLLFAYTFGYLLFMIASMVVSPESIPDWFVESYGSVPIDWISKAAILVFLVALVLRVLGWYSPSIGDGLQTTMRASRFDIVVLWTCLATVLAAYFVGDIGYRGVQTGTGGQLTGLGAFSATIAVPLIVSAFHLGISSRGLSRLQCFLISACAGLLVIPLGRREVFYSLLLIAIFWVARNHGRRLRVALRLRILTIAALAFVFVAMPAFLGFYALRAYENTGVERGQVRDVTVMSRGAISTLRSDTSDVISGLANNVGPRAGSLLAYLADNIRLHKDMSGDVAILSIKMVVPARFWPEKKAMFDEYGGSSESLIHPNLGLPVFDGPNSVLTEGFADFGLIGAGVYAIGLAFILTVCGAVVGRGRPDAGTILIAAAILYSTISIEKTLAGYLADLRHLVMLYVVFVVARLAVRTLVSLSHSEKRPGVVLSRSSLPNMAWRRRGE